MILRVVKLKIKIIIIIIRVRQYQCKLGWNKSKPSTYSNKNVELILESSYLVVVPCCNVMGSTLFYDFQFSFNFKSYSNVLYTTIIPIRDARVPASKLKYVWQQHVILLFLKPCLKKNCPFILQVTVKK